MSLRMLLEGPDLKGVLREVEANYGRDFHVIQAEQVRSGGVGGFFIQRLVFLGKSIRHRRHRSTTRVRGDR